MPTRRSPSLRSEKPRPSPPFARKRCSGSAIWNTRTAILDLALTHLAEAAQGDDDPTRVYLAHLFTGWVHEQANRMPEATASFRRALEAVNGLSAALALGVRLYAVDQRDDADAIVQAALAAAVVDPYKDYGYGDLRRWPAIIAGLRRSFSPR